MSWPVGFIFAVGGWLIGNKGNHDDSVFNLLTDLHAYPVRHETLTSGVPQGSRNPLVFSSIKPELHMFNESQVPAICARHTSFVFLRPTSIALTTHG